MINEINYYIHELTRRVIGGFISTDGLQHMQPSHTYLSLTLFFKSLHHFEILLNEGFLNAFALLSLRLRDFWFIFFGSTRFFVLKNFV